MQIIQSASFKKKVRRFHKEEKRILDKEIRKVLQSPTIGEEKKGDLRGVLVHKFNIRDKQYLLSYRFVGERVELIMIGPHENYYRELSKYLKTR